MRSDGLGAAFRGDGAGRGAWRSRLEVTRDLVSEHPSTPTASVSSCCIPPALAGATLSVAHADGRVETTAFPRAISPHQPVLRHRGPRLASTTASTVSVRFEGDVFEMEDQRNWTDASFKTYSRPLALPFPYHLGAGDQCAGRSSCIDVGAAGMPRVASRPRPTASSLVRGRRLPRARRRASTAPDPAPPGDPTSHRLCSSSSTSPRRNWRAALRRAASSGLPLDVRFVLADDDPLTTGGRRAARARRRARHGVPARRRRRRHVSDAAAIAALRSALARGRRLDAEVVGGARSHFTELNREHHRLPRDLDGIVFSVTPLFHSLGTEQLVESFAMQRLVAEQGVVIAAAVSDAARGETDPSGTGVPVHIGPIGLRPHFNDVATIPPPRPAADDLRDGYGPALLELTDPRQDAEQLAAWTIASAAALAVPGVATLTFFEEWGPRGIRDESGAERPVAAAMRALAELSGRASLHGASPDGLVWAIGALADDGAQTLLVAVNLDVTPRIVDVLHGGGLRIPHPPARRLDPPRLSQRPVSRASTAQRWSSVICCPSHGASPTSACARASFCVIVSRISAYAGSS